MSVAPIFSPMIHEPPIVVVPERVIAAMAAETKRYMTIETGESMVGIVIPPSESDPFREPIFFILGTIPADSAEHHAAMFELGGDIQVRIFSWLSKNWNAMREVSRAKPSYLSYRWAQKVPGGEIPQLFDRPLADLGDWHKHPGNMTHPSGGDLGTAIETLLDEGLNVRYLIAPVTTVSEVPDTKVGWKDTLVTHSEGNFVMNISFSYLSRRMIQTGQRQFMTVIPNIVPNDYLPQLPVLSWDLLDPELFQMEIKLLKDYGCTVEVIRQETRGGPPLEVCFSIKRQECERPWDYQLFVETPVGYPIDHPAVRIIKEESPAEASNQPNVAVTRSGLLGWLRSIADRTPLLHLPHLQHQESGGSFTWETNCTLLSLIMFLEKGGKMWKEQEQTTNGTE